MLKFIRPCLVPIIEENEFLNSNFFEKCVIKVEKNLNSIEIYFIVRMCDRK